MHDRKASGFVLRLAVAAAITVAAASSAEASAITDALEGKWSGSGSLSLRSGGTERIRCHGTTRSSTANSVNQNFRCATTGKNFAFSSSLHFDRGRVRGNWRSANRSGTVLGSATRSSINARLASSGGNGRLRATFSGCSQTLRITGWSDEMRSLSVRLRKDC